MAKFTSLTDAFVLSNGVKIPCVGFGTWQIENGDEALSSVKEALKAGYRHIDTAEGYGNEKSVGQAVRESGVPRGEIFITSKLANTMHGYDNTVTAFEQSLKDLGTDYLDLFLIHWPNPIKYRANWQEANAGTWRAFEEFYKDGRVKSIGVSNFHARHIDALLEKASIVPHVNQIRLCPGETQEAVVDYCRAHDILPEAYSPLGNGKAFKAPELKNIADKYGKSVAQLCIRWCLDMGYLPLPKSGTPLRIKENADVFGFELEAGDINALAGMTGICGLSANPDTITW